MKNNENEKILYIKNYFNYIKIFIAFNYTFNIS